MKLRKYQITISDQASQILRDHKFVLLAMKMRTGKTFTAFESIRKYWAKKVLFLTKKKAISSIKDDYKYYKDHFELTVINYESVHKITNCDFDFDFIVFDESHVLWTFPIPSQKFLRIKKSFKKLPMILLSGTPSPESYSQLFHQFFTSIHTPFSKYKNFYRWADEFVKIRKQKTSFWYANDYSKADYNKIMESVWHLIITLTQEQAGFTTEVKEKVLYVTMKPVTYDLVRQLKQNKVIEGKDEDILADTMVKEKQKIHQLFSGTIKFESWNSTIIDNTKGLFIKEKFKDNKIWIFYIFKEEKKLLKEVFWDDITDDLDEFNTTDKNIMLQVISWREGISLEKADFLVYFNISFSAVSYWQSRDRMTTMERKKNTIYWIFTKGWLEDEVYKAVQNKKKFTTKMYREWLKY